METLMKIARTVVLGMVAGVCWWVWIDLASAGIQSMTDYSHNKSVAIVVLLFIITTLVVAAVIGDQRDEI